MKFLITGDWHITNLPPINRIDNYEEAIFNKVNWLLTTAKKHNCTAVLQPGDMTDKYSLPDYLKRRYVMLFLSHGIKIITIPGQHDLRYHINKIENTAFGVFNAAYTQVASSTPIELGDNVDVYGAGWKSQIPEIKNKDVYNILLIHKMVIDNVKLWAEQKEYIMSATLATQYGYDIVVSGDNHNSFLYDKGNEILFNCGSLMRSTSAQMNHRPVCYVLDMQDMSYEPIYIPVDNIDDVMRVDEIIEEKDLNDELTSFVESFQSSAKSREQISGLDFSINLDDVLNSGKIQNGGEDIDINEDVRDYIEQIMEDVNGSKHRRNKK